MDCEEVSEKLQLLADGELPPEEYEALERRLEECKRLRDCENCRQAVQGMQRLKELIASSQSHSIPPNLESVVRDILTREDRSRRRRLMSLLAGMVLLLAGSSYVIFRSSPQRLAHAEIIEHCFAEYDRACQGADSCAPIAIAPKCLSRIIEDVKAIGGIDLKAMPLPQNARYIGCQSVKLSSSTPAVRLDFWPTPECCSSKSYRVSIFVLPLESVADAKKLTRGRSQGAAAYLRCGGGRENTIYCVVGSDHLFNLVTRHTLPVVQKMNPRYTMASAR